RRAAAVVRQLRPDVDRERALSGGDRVAADLDRVHAARHAGEGDLALHAAVVVVAPVGPGARAARTGVDGDDRVEGAVAQRDGRDARGARCPVVPDVLAGVVAGAALLRAR